MDSLYACSVKNLLSAAGAGRTYDAFGGTYSGEEDGFANRHAGVVMLLLIPE